MSQPPPGAPCNGARNAVSKDIGALRAARTCAAFAAFALLAVAGRHGLADEMKMPMKSMGDMMVSDAPAVPPVAGYAEGEEILFLHTETSDPELARVLTDMMGSPVLVVPALAELPKAFLAKVYVFANGLQPDGARGPLMYQPDVFEAPPGQPGYTPLRAVVLVRWGDEAPPRLLTSAGEVERAEAGGEIALEETGIVVNMPFVTWPGGHR